MLPLYCTKCNTHLGEGSLQTHKQGVPWCSISWAWPGCTHYCWYALWRLPPSTCAATLQPTCAVCPWQQHTPHSHNTMVTRLTIPCYSHVPAYVVCHALPPTQPPAANLSLAGWQAAGPCSVSQPRQHAAGCGLVLHAPAYCDTSTPQPDPAMLYQPPPTNPHQLGTCAMPLSAAFKDRMGHTHCTLAAAAAAAAQPTTPVHCIFPC